MSGVPARSPREAVVVEDFNRRVVSLGVDDRGPFAILECQHKNRRRVNVKNGEHTRWCNACANRSPYR